MSISWRIDAPDSNDVGNVDFRVRLEGRDENSGNNITEFTNTLAVTTVKKARLDLTAAI